MEETKNIEIKNIEEKETVKITKTILTAGAKEALVQLNLARKVAEKLFKNSGILSIRNEKPIIPENATVEEIEKLNNDKAIENISKMVDLLIEKNVDLFFEFIGLLFFLPKEIVENMPLKELLKPVFELFTNKGVQDFLVSLSK
ncbi:MAG: hypothetical protein RR189_02615 [Bacilli bacterium]